MVERRKPLEARRAHKQPIDPRRPFLPISRLAEEAGLAPEAEPGKALIHAGVAGAYGRAWAPGAACNMPPEEAHEAGAEIVWAQQVAQKLLAMPQPGIAPVVKIEGFLLG